MEVLCVALVSAFCGFLLGVSVVVNKREATEDVNEEETIDEEDMLVQLSEIMEYQPRRRRVRNGR